MILITIWTRWATLFLGKVLLASSLLNLYNFFKGSAWLNNKVILRLTFIRHNPVDLKGVFLKVLSFFFHRERCCGKFWLMAGWFQARVLGRKNVSGSPIWTSWIHPCNKIHYIFPTVINLPLHGCIHSVLRRFHWSHHKAERLLSKH